jgi:2-hydroxychromene-2-carboxylate isomerase
LSIKRKLRSRFLNVVLSARTRALKRRIAEVRRMLTGRRHFVSVFLELDDPYSYLLSHYLPTLAASYDVDLRLYLTQALGGAYSPRPDMQAEYAIQDCERLAHELGVPFLDKGSTPPVEHRRALLDALAGNAADPGFDSELLDAIAAYWRGDTEAVQRRAVSAAHGGSADALLEKNQRSLQKLGHYNTAMLHYGGEWYWGIDRLHYLIARLAELGLQRDDKVDSKLASIHQAMIVSLPIRPLAAASELPPIEIFHSFRSPYSYLSLLRVFEVADAFGMTVRVRPVLPMVMRGMQVPRAKLVYIVKDAKREADRLGIPFGNIADPVGIGTERCMAVFDYAVGENRHRDFLINAGEAIWSQAIDVATDKGMRKVTGRTGLFWPDAKAAMADDAWRDAAEENRESMMGSGSWGVPTIRVGEFTLWGQDRIWLLVRHLEELCDSGDGILI